MDFIHSREYYSANDIIVLNCDTQCNFMIMTDADFSYYQSGGSHHYYADIKHIFQRESLYRKPAGGM
jgi:hypothetical protein